MSASKELIIKEEYPYIPDENSIIIQSYFNKLASAPMSDTTFTSRKNALKIICELINEGETRPFKEWDENIVRHYLRMLNHSLVYLRVILSVLVDILKDGGCKSDLSKIKADDFIAEYKSDLLTLEDLEDRMDEKFKKTHPQYLWDSMNDWSSTIVLCYLLWLGLTKQDVVSLKQSDYHNSTEAFIVSSSHNSRVIQLPPYSNISKYIKMYAEASGYNIYNDFHKDRFIHYAQSDSFLKYVYAFGGISLEIVENYGRNINTYFGFQPDEILLAGRLNTIYNINAVSDGSIPVNLKNGKVIAQVLGMDKVGRISKESSIGTIILKYPEYKRRRDIRRNKNENY